MKSFILSTVLAAVMLFLINSNSLAAETDSLLSASDYEVSAQPLAATDNFIARGPTGAPCVRHEFKTMVRQLISVSPFFVPAQSHNSSCATPTKFGYMHGKYLYQQGETLSGEVVPDINLLALPNSDTILAGVTNFNAHNIRVWNDYSPFINKAPQQYGRIWYDLPGSAGSTNFITDKSGQRLPFAYNTVRSSTNAEWMVIYMPVMGMARVNVESREVLPFSDVRGSTSLAVSDSGRYAAVFYSNDKSLMVFDLSSCDTVPNRITRGVTCPMKNLASELNLPGQLENVRYVRFSGENMLYLELEYRDQSGQLTRTRADLAPQGVDVGGIDYIAMGDSFASGEGELNADWYELGTDVNPNNMCHLSRRSYHYLISDQLNLNNAYSVACSGAKTNHVMHDARYEDVPLQSGLGEWHPGRRPQLGYLTMETGGISDFLTISIGGNNVDFSNKLKSCVMSPSTCSFATEDKINVAREIAGAHKDILEAYKQLAEKTEGRSKIYALGYPQFIQSTGGSCGANVGLLNEEERLFINQAVTYLNQVVRSAAEEAGVYYIDLESSLSGRNLCSGTSQEAMTFNGITAGDDNLGILANETYHPNHMAHELFKTSILSQTGGDPILWQTCHTGANICPRGDGLIPLPDISYWGAEAQSYVTLMNDPQSLIAELPPKHQPIVVDSQTYYQPGQELRIVAGRFAPGTEVEIVLRSEPTTLANATADINGFIDTVVKIPEAIEFGFHNLHLLGVNSVNQLVDYYESVPVFVKILDEPEVVTPETSNNEPEAIEDSTPEQQDVDNTDTDDDTSASEDEATLVIETGAIENESPAELSSQESDTSVLADTKSQPEDNPSSTNAVSTLPFMALLALVTGTVIFIWKKARSVRF